MAHRGAGTTKTYEVNFAISQWQLASIQTPERKAAKMAKTTKQVASIQTPQLTSIETPQLASIQTPTKETLKESLKEIPESATKVAIQETPEDGKRLSDPRGLKPKTGEQEPEGESREGDHTLETLLSEANGSARGGAAKVAIQENLEDKKKLSALRNKMFVSGLYTDEENFSVLKSKSLSELESFHTGRVLVTVALLCGEVGNGEVGDVCAEAAVG